MYDAHFKRIEQKYLINNYQKEKLLEKIKKYIEKDKYYYSEIHNIYFDTLDNEIINRSLAKPIFKDKFRIRSYGLPTLNDEIFLEIKTKYNGIVGKRRTKMKLKDFYNYLETKKIDNDNQILKEFNYYFNYYNLKETIYIAYDRISYKGKDDPSLRITLDYNLRSRRNNLKLETRTNNIKYFTEDIYIMEIKIINAMPLWLVKALSELEIYPSGFSKYGKIYEKESEEK